MAARTIHGAIHGVRLGLLPLMVDEVPLHDGTDLNMTGIAILFPGDFVLLIGVAFFTGYLLMEFVQRKNRLFMVEFLQLLFRKQAFPTLCLVAFIAGLLFTLMGIFVTGGTLPLDIYIGNDLGAFFIF